MGATGNSPLPIEATNDSNKTDENIHKKHAQKHGQKKESEKTGQTKPARAEVSKQQPKKNRMDSGTVHAVYTLGKRLLRAEKLQQQARASV